MQRLVVVSGGLKTLLSYQWPQGYREYRGRGVVVVSSEVVDCRVGSRAQHMCIGRLRGVFWEDPS